MKKRYESLLAQIEELTTVDIIASSQQGGNGLLPDGDPMNENDNNDVLDQPGIW